jgi:hypothetical protein
VLATLTATYSHGDGSFPTEMARRLVEQDLEHARVYLEALEVALAPLIGDLTPSPFPAREGELLERAGV